MTPVNVDAHAEKHRYVHDDDAQVDIADADKCCSPKPQCSAPRAELKVLWLLYVGTLFDQCGGEFILAYRRRARPIKSERHFLLRYFAGDMPFDFLNAE